MGRDWPAAAGQYPVMLCSEAYFVNSAVRSREEVRRQSPELILASAEGMGETVEFTREDHWHRINQRALD
jgi:hypothetical protein